MAIRQALFRADQVPGARVGIKFPANRQALIAGNPDYPSISNATVQDK
jgi:hypothetical protein